MWFPLPAVSWPKYQRSHTSLLSQWPSSPTWRQGSRDCGTTSRDWRMMGSWIGAPMPSRGQEAFMSLRYIEMILIWPTNFHWLIILIGRVKPLIAVLENVYGLLDVWNQASYIKLCFKKIQQWWWYLVILFLIWLNHSCSNFSYFDILRLTQLLRYMTRWGALVWQICTFWAMWSSALHAAASQWLAEGSTSCFFERVSAAWWWWINIIELPMLESDYWSNSQCWKVTSIVISKTTSSHPQVNGIKSLRVFFICIYMILYIPKICIRTIVTRDMSII